MKYAIVQSGGKQYRCEEGDTIEVDLLAVEPGDALTLAEVLLVVNGSDVKVGTPTVSGALIQTIVEKHLKGPKKIAFRYKPKERQRRIRGHRQNYTRLKIEAIQG